MLLSPPAVAAPAVAAPAVAAPAVAAPAVEGSVGQGSGSVAENNPLRIDVEPTIADAKLFPVWIRERHPGLEERIPRISGHSHWIVVRIEGATYKYRVRISAMRDGKKIGAMSDIFSCDCNSEVLLEIIDEGIAQAIERFEVSSVSPVGAAGSMSSSGRYRGQATAKDDLASDSYRSRLKIPGYVGVGMGVLGVGALAAGIPLMRLSSFTEGVPGNLEIYSYREPGIALVVVGSVGLMAGGMLVAIDVARRRERKSLVAPVVSSRFFGISLRREF